MKKITAIIATIIVFSACEKKENAEEKTITILQSTDIHAYLNPHEELYVEKDSIVFKKAGGLAVMKTLVNEQKNKNPEGTIFIDAGDLIQGSGASMLSKGSIFPPIVQAMEYDLLIPGNWEVIYGKKIMMQIMNNYKSNVIAANMFDEETQKPLFPPYWITEKKGIKIGFIAYNDPEIPERQNPKYSEGITFTPVEENLKTLITQLKKEEKVELLFLITHIGIAKQVQLANNPITKEVDFILGSDTHERIRKPIKGKYSYVVEPGAFGSFLGKLDIKMKNKKMVNFSYELMDVNPEKTKANPKIQKLVNQALRPYQKEMQQIVGHTTTPLYRYLVVENPMDNLITDALLWKTGADFATSNGFRFGVPIVPDETGKKAITKADIWRMLPVNEHMKIGKVTGLQIKNWLEKEINNVFAKEYENRFGGWLVRFSGLTLKFDSSLENGNRIQEIKIQGKPLDLKKTYTMASCNRTGEPLETMCRMKNAKDVTIQNYTLHQALEEYLKVKSPVSPKLDGRAIATDLGINAFSQMKETGYQFQ